MINAVDNEMQPKSINDKMLLLKHEKNNKLTDPLLFRLSPV